jgi:hypothetical protein
MCCAREHARSPRSRSVRSNGGFRTLAEDLRVTRTAPMYYKNATRKADAWMQMADGSRQAAVNEFELAVDPRGSCE